MPIFDAMDGPVHAPLRAPVRPRRLRGWALLLAGLGGVVLLLALSKEADAVYAVVLGAVLMPVFWWLDGRDLGKGLDKVRPATAEASIVPFRPARLIRGPMLVAGLIVLTVLTGFTPAAAGVALAMGATDLVTAGTLSRWERRNDKTLFVAGEDLFAR
ncbi:hypothetical protein [Solirubrobacter soli]|uniref:hypothetical protein n=1 Tax=Solirubrobacter soli TaxID=363832 RepID=UPI000410219E|nr:hypothetical protein [Solirubrobacter soli]